MNWPAIFICFNLAFFAHFFSWFVSLDVCMSAFDCWRTANRPLVHSFLWERKTEMNGSLSFTDHFVCSPFLFTNRWERDKGRMKWSEWNGGRESEGKRLTKQDECSLSNPHWNKYDDSRERKEIEWSDRGTRHRTLLEAEPMEREKEISIVFSNSQPFNLLGNRINEENSVRHMDTKEVFIFLSLSTLSTGHRFPPFPSLNTPLSMMSIPILFPLVGSHHDSRSLPQWPWSITFLLSQYVQSWSPPKCSRKSS